MIVNGLVNIVITTIERRYGLKSTETGLIAGGYDISSFLCLIPVSYLGGRIAASKPRWLGIGILLMALGAFVFSIPHFTAPRYQGGQPLMNLCNSTMGLDPCNVAEGSRQLSEYKWVFLCGQLLLGAGASPLYTLGVAFVDENVSTKMSSVYLGE